MSELGEKPPEVEGYLLGVHTVIRNSLFMSLFFLNDVGLMPPLFACTSQQSTIEISILH